MFLKKFLLTGMAVLLSVSFILTGCQPEADDDDGGDDPTLSSNAVIGGPGTGVKIKGKVVRWDTSDFAKDGTSFTKAVPGTLDLVTNNSGDDEIILPTGATAEVWIKDAETVEANLGNSVGGEDFSFTAGNASTTKYVYLKVTAENGVTFLWYAITVTIVTPESNTVIGDGVRIKDETVVWTSRGDGTLASTAREGAVTLALGATGASDFKLPPGATVEGYIESAETASPSANSFATAAAFDTTLATASTGEKYVYLKVTAQDETAERWYLITVTISEDQAWPSSAVFRLVELTGSRAKLRVKNGNTFGSAAWYTVPSSGEDAQLDVLQTVYDPNKAGATLDDVTLDAAADLTKSKTAVEYTQALSDKVLALFQFTTDESGEIIKIEITGTDLPSANEFGATSAKLIVIDLGNPGEDNSELFGDGDDDLKFSIPNRGLGASGGEYDYIRLRVNEGVSLTIEANNAGYVANGAGYPCPEGYFNGGCVEVMAGGYLRDGAFEGFPLGSHAVILNRFGSYLSVGPDPTSPEATGDNTKDAYNDYYVGYLLGPDPGEEENDGYSGPRIIWDEESEMYPNNSPSSYLEVRPAEIATNARLTAKLNIGLIYSVWFVDNAHVTIDIATAGDGLWANETAGGPDYNFYAKDTTSGEMAKTVITVKSGVLDGRFLTEGADDWKNDNSYVIMSTDENEITIPAPTGPTGEEGSEKYYPAGDTSGGISGYLVVLPDPEENED
jgi:hypothetical protein